jgi:pimeloyl-ACP methyl ester carboxylesterase
MQLVSQRLGAGHPLIVLHGLFGSLTNWRSLSNMLAERYLVVAVDQRNHGSSPHSDTFNYQVMAEDLRELMAAQELSTAYLLGHSMGGKTAMQFAILYPDVVDALIVVDIAPKAYPPGHDAILDALNALDVSAYGRRADLDRALSQDIEDLTIRQFLLTNVTRNANGEFKWKINLDAISSNYGEIIAGLDPAGRFEKPTLFVRGERSEYIQPDDEGLITTMFPRATIVTVPGVGHWVHAEAPAALAQIVVEFLEAVPVKDKTNQ